jgi:ubiquinone/menaquinone biosynthesis C-methylase UbiE
MSMAKQEKIQQHYDAIANIYDTHYDLYRGKCYHTHISRHLMQALPKSAYLLDIGCGTGLFIEKYTMVGGSAVGIDLSRRMIDRARERCAGSDFTIGTGETVPFSDNTFDAVSSLLVFSYLRDPPSMLTEAYRVLKPGGTIAVCTLGKKLVTRGIPALYVLSEKMKVRHVVMKDFGERYYDEDEMARFFYDAGFSDIRTSWCSFAHIDMINPLFRFARRVEPFVERRLPQLAYNICVTARKPKE